MYIYIYVYIYIYTYTYTSTNYKSNCKTQNMKNNTLNCGRNKIQNSSKI